MTFEAELKDIINSHGKDNDCNTPDFILARYLRSCLFVFTTAMTRRDALEGKIERHDCQVQPAVKPRDSWAGLEMPKSVHALHEREGPSGPLPPKSVLGVEGHYIGCLIDLDNNYHPCTCGAG